MYAATVIPEDQRTEAVLAEVVNSLVPGQGLTANDIAAIPPNLPSTSSNEDPGETPGTARVLGPLPPGVLTITGAVGRDDPSDFYRFEIEQISDIEIALTNLSNDGRLQLIQDLNDDGEFGLGELIFESNASGTLNENISSALDPGTYFIQVLPGNVDATTEVGYTLTTNVSVPSNNINPEPGNTLVSATELDEFNTDFRGFVSTLSDADDFYRFELTQITDIEITLRGLSGDARLELIQDLNNNGELDLNELVFASDASGTLNEDIESALDSGTYFVRVLPGDDDATGVGYTLRVNASLPSNRIDPEPGNTLVDATELDGFNTDFRGFVSTLSDADDFYRFELAQITDIEITLRNLSGDGRLELIQDLNDNGNLDLNELIFASDASGTLNEDIESVLDPGTYFIRILPGDDDATGVGYTLRVNASLPGNRIDPEPGNTLVDATELDEFNTEFRGFVSTLSDSDDFYRFELEQITGIEITLRDLSGDGRLELIQDSNNNGDFDFNELLFESNSSGTLSEDIETTLDPGTYFIRVLPGSESATGVGYTLRANA
ncbi:MAG: PPC domain-containing protein [Cyanobacteria bacterium J06642_2]